MDLWNYAITGTTGDGTTWHVQGSLQAHDLDAAIEKGRRHAFIALTEGKAEFGKPGQGTCQGPYKITRLLVEKPHA